GFRTSREGPLMAETIGHGGNNRIARGNVQSRGSVKSSDAPRRSLGTGVTGTGKAPVVHAPRYAPAAAPQTPSYGGGGGGVGYGGGGGGGAVGALSLGAPSETDWLAGDSGYQAQLAALLKALQNT